MSEAEEAPEGPEGGSSTESSGTSPDGGLGLDPSKAKGLRSRKLYRKRMTVREKVKFGGLIVLCALVVGYLFYNPPQIGGERSDPQVARYLDDPRLDAEIPERTFEVEEVDLPPDALAVEDGTEGHHDLAYATLVHQVAGLDQATLEERAGDETIEAALALEHPRMFRGRPVRVTGRLMYLFDISVFNGRDARRRDRLEELAADELAADPETWAELGYLRAAAGELEAAEEAWDRALELEPDHRKARSGKVLLASGVRTVYRGAIAFQSRRDGRSYMFRFDILDKHRAFPTHEEHDWGALVELDGIFYKTESFPTDTGGTRTLPVVIGRRLIRLRAPTLEESYPWGLLIAGFAFAGLTALVLVVGHLMTRKGTVEAAAGLRERALEAGKEQVENERLRAFSRAAEETEEAGEPPDRGSDEGAPDGGEPPAEASSEDAAAANEAAAEPGDEEE